MSDSLIVEVLSRIGEVQNQIGVVQGQNTLILTEQQDAMKSRSLIHQKLDDVRSDVAQVTSRVLTLEREVSRIAPLVDTFSNERYEKIGGRKMLSSGQKLAAASIAAVGGPGALWLFWDKLAIALHIRPHP